MVIPKFSAAGAPNSLNKVMGPAMSKAVGRYTIVVCIPYQCDGGSTSTLLLLSDAVSYPPQTSHLIPGTKTLDTSNTTYQGII